MARCEHLPIWRCAMDLALHMETAVAGFPRVHRYALGAQLRRGAQAILPCVMRSAPPLPVSFPFASAALAARSRREVMS